MIDLLCSKIFTRMKKISENSFAVWMSSSLNSRGTVASINNSIAIVSTQKYSVSCYTRKTNLFVGDICLSLVISPMKRTFEN